MPRTPRRHVVVWEHSELYVSNTYSGGARGVSWALEGSSVFLDHPQRRLDRLRSAMLLGAERLEYPRPEQWRVAGETRSEKVPGALTHGPQVTFRRFADGVLTHVYRLNRFTGSWHGGRVDR